MARESAARTRASTSISPALAEDAQEILRHWREAVPHDRLAHLVKDATRAFVRALSVRLATQGIAFGHWAFLRVLWEEDGITQKALSVQAGTDDIAVGTPASMRRHLHSAGLVGMFVSTVALRTTLRVGVTSDELLLEVRNTDAAALDNALVKVSLEVLST